MSTQLARIDGWRLVDGRGVTTMPNHRTESTKDIDREKNVYRSLRLAVLLHAEDLNGLFARCDALRRYDAIDHVLRLTDAREVVIYFNRTVMNTSEIIDFLRLHSIIK